MNHHNDKHIENIFPIDRCMQWQNPELNENYKTSKHNLAEKLWSKKLSCNRNNTTRNVFY